MTGTKRNPGSKGPSRDSSISPFREDDPFDDKNDVESLGVADGFQSSFNLQNIPSNTRKAESRSSNVHNKSSVFRDNKTKPSSTQENAPSLIPRNSFSLRHDAQYSDHPRRLPSVSSTTGPPQRSDTRPVSLLSRQSTYVRPESTYVGPSAPSHPYGMYPQNSSETANRTSVASTNRPTRERSYHGRDRPTHPYAMYPQNPTSESDTDTMNASTDIASVGFPGLNHQYARRLGPDGEEADDIIGPDGHTEQLPPYTRYPNIGPMHMPPKRDSQVGHNTLPTIPADTSSTANDATSMSDTLLSPTAYDSTAHLANAESSNRTSKEKWSKRSRRKTCFGRLPVWAVALAIIFLIAASAAMGGLIGRFLGKPRHNESITSNSSTTTTGFQSTSSSAVVDPSMPTFGAAPLSTPLPTPPALPLGTFSLTLYPPSEECGTCLTGSQRSAWDCVPNSTAMTFTVQNSVLSAANVSLTGPDPGTVPLKYGSQFPNLQSDITASYNLDPNNKLAGTALYFNTTYTKQVLLYYDPNSKIYLPSKRSLESTNTFEAYQIFSRNQRAQDQIKTNVLVWNCTWPRTNIDGFIYINVDVPAGTTVPATTPPSPAASAPATPATPYPKKVKLVEYRSQGADPASCTLMNHKGGAWVPLDTPPAANVPITFPLQETDPHFQGKFVITKWRQHEAYHGRRDQYQGYCSCELANTP